MGELASRGQLRASFLRVAVVTVPLVVFLGSLSGLLSNSGYDNPWFAALEKPALIPPGWVFAVAWPALYALMGCAVAMVWHARGAPGRGIAIGLFIVQLLMNYAWSPLFFAAHKVNAALWLIVALVVLTVATIAAFARVRVVAAVLLLPYLAWLGFATYLNWQIDRLNPAAEQGVEQGIQYEL